MSFLYRAPLLRIIFRNRQSTIVRVIDIVYSITSRTTSCFGGRFTLTGEILGRGSMRVSDPPPVKRAEGARIYTYKHKRTRARRNVHQCARTPSRLPPLSRPPFCLPLSRPLLSLSFSLRRGRRHTFVQERVRTRTRTYMCVVRETPDSHPSSPSLLTLAPHSPGRTALCVTDRNCGRACKECRIKVRNLRYS